MPELGLRLSIGEVDADSIIGPIGGGPTIDGVYKLEDDSGFYLTAANDYLAFETAETALWTPTRISTVGWWDASDASTVTTSGSEVTSVTDKSGNGYTLAPLTGSKSGPTIGTTTQNGLNVFEYSNTIPNNQVLENNSFSWNQSNTEIAFAIVFRCNDEGTLDQDFLLSGTETQNPRIGVRRTTDNKLQTISTGASIATSINSIVEGQTFLSVFKFNGTSSTIRLDGTQRASGNIGTSSFSSLNIGTNFQEDQSIEGFIGEIIAFSDSSKTELIEGYLAHKWGIDGNLDSLHPYALGAPTI